MLRFVKLSYAKLRLIPLFCHVKLPYVTLSSVMLLYSTLRFLKLRYFKLL